MFKHISFPELIHDSFKISFQTIIDAQVVSKAINKIKQALIFEQ